MKVSGKALTVTLRVYTKRQLIKIELRETLVKCWTVFSNENHIFFKQSLYFSCVCFQLQYEGCFDSIKNVCYKLTGKKKTTEGESQKESEELVLIMLEELLGSMKLLSLWKYSLFLHYLKFIFKVSIMWSSCQLWWNLLQWVLYLTFHLCVHSLWSRTVTVAREYSKYKYHFFSHS